MCAALLESSGVPSLAAMTVIDLGCGRGEGMQTLIELGAEPAGLVGVDVLADRLGVASRRHPRCPCIHADGRALPVLASTVDVVALWTVFSSTGSREVRAGLADEIDRVLRPGGLVLWYDVRSPNPRNPHVRPIRLRAVRADLPGYLVTDRSITLLPPLARRLGRLAPALYPVLAALPFLRTHVVAVLTKPS